MWRRGQFVNLVPSWLLRSPAHRILSSRYVIVSFAGRRSGKEYTTPVAYVRDGDTVWMSTDSRWWRNLVGGAPVRLCVRGRTLVGEATVITDEQEAVEVLRRLVEAIPSYSKPAQLQRSNGRVPDDELARAVRDGRRSIRIQLQDLRAGADR